jgi:hypothetical protein
MWWLHISLVFGLMAVATEVVELGVWSLLWRLIMYMPTANAWNIGSHVKLFSHRCLKNSDSSSSNSSSSSSSSSSSFIL